mgnify:CR=1 FL=1
MQTLKPLILTQLTNNTDTLKFWRKIREIYPNGI